MWHWEHWMLPMPHWGRNQSAVAELGRLVEQLPARRDEGAVAVTVHSGRQEGGHPVAVLEREFHAEVPFQATPDRVGRQRAQQLTAFGLARRWRGVVGEFGGSLLGSTGHLADQIPRVRQGHAN